MSVEALVARRGLAGYEEVMGCRAGGAFLIALVTAALPAAAAANKLGRKLDALYDAFVKHGAKVGIAGIALGTTAMIVGSLTADPAHLAFGAGTTAGGVATVFSAKAAARDTPESERQAQQFRDRIQRGTTRPQPRHDSRAKLHWETLRWKATHLFRGKRGWGR